VPGAYKATLFVERTFSEIGAKVAATPTHREEFASSVPHGIVACAANDAWL